MFKNFIKIALRNLVKNRLYTLINITGLSVALGCCIVAYLNYQFAMGFDLFHKNADKVFRINSIKFVNNQPQRWGITPMPLGPALQRDFQGVERAVRIAEENIVPGYGEKVFNENLFLVDDGFFDMFTFPLKYGFPEALKERNKLVISDDLSEKYFGDANPVGKQVTIRYGDGQLRDFVIGYAKDEVVVVYHDNANALETFKNALDQNPQMANIAGARQHVGYSWYRRPVKYESVENDVQIFRIGHGYLETMGLRLQTGRDFDPNLQTDYGQSLIVTEKFVRDFGCQDALGKQVMFDSVRYTIIGVIDDFYTNGFWAPVEASALWLARPDEYRLLAVRAEKENLAGINATLSTE